MLNPHNITQGLFISHKIYCEGSFEGDKVNISEIAINIGLVAGTGYRLNPDGTKDLTNPTMPNSTWEKPIYACAGATKASIKTVHFRFNTTVDASLQNLEVLKIKDKVYKDVTSLPIWGFETPFPAYNISWINPLWGLVDEAGSQNRNITTVTSDHFYIPKSALSVSNYGSPDTSSGENMPAIQGPSELLAWAMQDQSVGYDYSGVNDLDLAMLWQEITQNTTGVASALRLIWTDYAANYLVGTKGLHTPRYRQPIAELSNRKRQPNVEATRYPVFVLQHRIQYRWIYAIPAFICVAIVAAVIILATVSMICGRGTIAHLQYYLYSITPGRIMTVSQHPEGRAVGHAETKEWIKVVGHKHVSILAAGVTGKMAG